MKPARLILLLVAIVAGGLAAFLATRGNAPAPKIEQVTQVEQEARTQIMVARKPIGVGERLTPENIEWQGWPAEAVRPEYVTIEAVPDAMERLNGAVARFEIFTGEPVREAKLARAGRGYLSAVITPGMRAVSIGVSATAGAGGFIVPNDHVDVLLTRETAAGRQSQTILRNVKVLAIGLRLGERGETGGQSASDEEDDPTAKTFSKDTIATLELDPYQSETIVNASQVGRISLVLRSVVDFGETDAGLQNGNNASVRMIRYGNSQTVMTGASATSALPETSGEGAMPGEPVQMFDLEADFDPTAQPDMGADEAMSEPASSLPPGAEAPELTQVR